MKKLLLPFLSFTSFFSFGQITVPSSDLPTIGTSLVTITDVNLSGFSAGNAGANQTYDFFLLQNTMQDTTDYLDPAQTPYGDVYPNATMASYQHSDSTYMYMNLSGNQLIMEGMTMPNPFGVGNGVVYTSDPLIQFEFPIVYQNSFNDVGQFNTSAVYFFQEITPDPYTYFDSIRANITMTSSVNVDGWGTFLSPFGYQIPVLRQATMMIQAVTPEFNMVMVDTLFGNPVTIPLGWQTIPGTEFTDTTTTYYYLANTSSDNPMIIAEVQKNAMGDIVSAKYAKMNQMALAELTASEVFVSPNPAVNEIKVQTPGNIQSLAIFNMDGKELFSQKVNYNEVTLSIENLASGNYLLHVNTDKGLEIKKIVKK